MGLTKTALFTEEQNELSQLARVLGHPARIAILEHLLSAQTCINSDLVQELGLAQATISQHLKELKSAGLIQGSIEGTSMCYCINAEAWSNCQTLIADFFDRFPNQNNCC